MEVGDRIRARLNAIGMSQSELARRVGVRQSTIAGLIAGKARSSSHLHKIARELHTTPAYLTGETDDLEANAPDAPMLDSQSRELIDCFAEMGAADRGALLQIARTMRGTPPPRAGTSIHAPRVGFHAADNPTGQGEGQNDAEDARKSA